MGFAIAVTFALCTWVVLYGIGIKSFDGFFLMLMIIATAAGSRILANRIKRDELDD